MRILNKYMLLMGCWNLISILAILPAYPQFYISIFQNRVDTLYTQFQELPETRRAHVYNQLAFHYSFDHADSCFYYSDKALNLALKNNDRFEEASSYRHKGNAYALIGDYRNAIYYLQSALKIFEEMKANRAILETMVDLSRTNYDVGLYDRMVKQNKEFRRMINENDGPPLLTPFEEAIITGLIAISYREAGEYEKGINLFRKYLRLSGQVNIPPTTQMHFVKSAAEIFTYAGQYDSALKYTLYARKFLPENRDKHPDQYTGYEGALGDLYFYLDDPALAIPNYRKHFMDEHGKGSNRYAAMAACDLGDVYLALEQYDSTIYYYKSAFQEAKKLHVNVGATSQSDASPNVYEGYQYFYNISSHELREFYYRLMVRVHKSFYRYFKKTNNLSASLRHHEALLLYKDSLSTSKNNMEFRRMQLQFDTEQIEQENALLQRDIELKDSRIKQNRLIIGSISVISLLLLVIGLVIFRQNRLKSLQEKILLEQRLLRTQMNPHFIFNSLASIQNFIFKKDDINASIYLSRFSELVRSILEHSTKEFITFEQEINTIRNYLELQKVRFQDKFDYSIDVDENIDEEVMEIPPMLAQPFIENAIEHGIRHKEGKGQIHIRYKRSNDVTIFEVEDDGVGRERAQQIEASQNGRHLSMATSITRERLVALNRKSRNKISLDIIDLKDEAGKAVGTKVMFFIPG